uniref:Calcium voltage-gated channel auxiliary subunit alpha2delta 1 n=1 Tax=Naja naja TaxID=35670 RepID=A0A8C6Y1S7_NAJNA
VVLVARSRYFVTSFSSTLVSPGKSNINKLYTSVFDNCEIWCVLFCFLLQIYQRNKNLYTVEANNARQLVESAAQDIEKLLSNRSTALVRLAEAAEKFQKEHQWQDEFAVSLCFYFTDFPIENETGSQRIKPVFEEDPLFGRQTSYQHAAVHIPTDIYDGCKYGEIHIIVNALSDFTNKKVLMYTPLEEESSHQNLEHANFFLIIFHRLQTEIWLYSFNLTFNHLKINLFFVCFVGQNQLILGVMGVDVSLEEIKKVTPRFTLCPNGYYFAIDPNGYVLLHPNLQPKHIGVGIPKVKQRRPHVQNPKSQEPVTLDFLDAELENDIKVEIRKKMIDGESGDRTFQTLVKSQDERYIDKGNRTYTWTAVNGTDYSLALVLPSYSFYYIKAKINETLTQAKFIATLKRESFDEVGYTFLAPRDYCSTVKITDNNTVFLQNFIEFMDQYSPENPSCNGLVMRALLDAGFTSDLVQNYWSKQDPEGITARFVATDGGITRVYPKSAGEYWTENAETYEQSFYKRSLDNENYIFTAPFFNRKSLVAQNIHNLLQQCRFCCNYLKQKFFKYSSDPIGKFFGEIDPGLMRNLINMSLYAFNKSYDYQSVCDPEDEPKQGAGLRSINVPTIADILHLGWWASAAAWSVLQQLVWGLSFPRFLGAVEVEEEDFSGFPSKQSCITVQTQYFFGSDDKSFSGILDCINCSRLFHAEKISNTNLVFIMSDSKELCHHCDARPLMQAEKPDEGPNPCEMVQHPRYRKGPDACFDDAKDDSTECGGVSGLSPSLWSMVGIQFILLWILSGSGPCQL